MARENYPIPDNPVYTEELPQLVNSDPANAEDILNPQFLAAHSNIKAVKLMADTAQAKAEEAQQSAGQAGANSVPLTRKINGKALTGDIALSAADVGARPDTWMPSAAEVGAVPVARKVNNKALSADVSLNAADVGARPANWTPTATDVGAVPTSRTVNGKPLTGNIALSAADVSARPSNWTPTAAEVGAVPAARKVNNKALSVDISLTAADVGAVPTTRTVNGKPLTGNISLTAADVGAVGATGDERIYALAQNGGLFGLFKFISSFGDYGRFLFSADGRYAVFAGRLDSEANSKDSAWYINLTSNSGPQRIGNAPAGIVFFHSDYLCLINSSAQLSLYHYTGNGFSQVGSATTLNGSQSQFCFGFIRNDAFYVFGSTSNSLPTIYLLEISKTGSVTSTLLGGASAAPYKCVFQSGNKYYIDTHGIAGNYRALMCYDVSTGAWTSENTLLYASSYRSKGPELRHGNYAYWTTHTSGGSYYVYRLDSTTKQIINRSFGSPAYDEPHILGLYTADGTTNLCAYGHPYVNIYDLNLNFIRTVQLPKDTYIRRNASAHVRKEETVGDATLSYIFNGRYVLVGPTNGVGANFSVLDLKTGRISNDFLTRDIFNTTQMVASSSGNNWINPTFCCYRDDAAFYESIRYKLIATPATPV